jgi:hypothetical protein
MRKNFFVFKGMPHYQSMNEWLARSLVEADAIATAAAYSKENPGATFYVMAVTHVAVDGAATPTEEPFSRSGLDGWVLSEMDLIRAAGAE